jgi:hypothetical protein
VTEPAACLNCGETFQRWPGQQYCSKACRKRAQNERLGYVKGPFRQGGAIPIPGDPSNGSQPDSEPPDGGPETAFKGSGLSGWVACIGCGARIRVTYGPPRCNGCFNTAKTRQREIEKRYAARMGEAPGEGE